MTDITPSAFASLQSDVAHVKATLDRLATQVEPLLLARSGDLAAIASIQRDVDSSHEKHREHGRRFSEIDDRIDKVERRFENARAYVIGAAAVIQILISIIGPSILRLLGFGG